MTNVKVEGNILGARHFSTTQQILSS